MLAGSLDRTPRPRPDELQGDLPLMQRAYICEEADDVTIKQLAALAGQPVAVLETRRNPGPWADCPAMPVMNRVRCWRCPRWRETNETPF